MGTAELPGMEQPVHYYLPPIVTAGIGFYNGDQHRVTALTMLRENRIDTVGISYGPEL